MNPDIRRIDSAANPSVKAWRSLHKRPERDSQRRFLIEGLREISRAAGAGVAFEALLISSSANPQERAAAASLAPSTVGRFELGDAALKKVSVRSHPAGLIAVAQSPTFDLEALALPRSPLLLIADSIEKPGNIGAMFRSADGAGADAVIVSDPITDLLNPNVIRSSQGAIFSVPSAVGPSDELAAWLAANAITVVSAAAEATADLWSADLTGATAIVVGSEHAGLSAAWQTTTTVRIPMLGASDSLNASVAAALLLYEARRQRGRTSGT